MLKPLAYAVSAAAVSFLTVAWVSQIASNSPSSASVAIFGEGVDRYADVATLRAAVDAHTATIDVQKSTIDTLEFRLAALSHEVPSAGEMEVHDSDSDALRLQSLEQSNVVLRQESERKDRIVKELQQRIDALESQDASRNLLIENFEAELTQRDQSLASLSNEISSLRERLHRSEAAAALELPHVQPPDRTAGSIQNRQPAEPVQQSPSASVSTPDDVAPDATMRHQPPVSAGVDAYRSGNYAVAYAAWKPAADSGDAAAQFHVGALYYEGRGVTRDLRSARYWLDRARTGGDDRAARLLEKIVTFEMTSRVKPQ